MLILWLPPGSTGNSLAVEAGGRGTGTGASIGDGTSSGEDAHGDNDQNFAGDGDLSVDASAGRNGPQTGIDAKAAEGHESGSWASQSGHDGSDGRVYATSLALLTLEAYYRHKRMF